MKTLLMALLLLMVVTVGVWADVNNVSLDEHLNGQIPLNLQFTDENGREVTLGRYFGKQPVVLVLAWYQCPGLCSEVQTGMVQCLMDLPENAGTDFQVVTVSIDPTETAELARPQKEITLTRYGRLASADGFHYLSGQKAAIDALCQSVGFRYTFDARTHQYAHPAGMMVLTPEGRLSRYLYGVRYSSRDLKLALEDSSHGRIGSPAEKLYLLCFRYDPTTGRYGLAVLRLLKASSAVTLLGLAIFWWRNRHV